MMEKMTTDSSFFTESEISLLKKETFVRNPKANEFRIIKTVLKYVHKVLADCKEWSVSKRMSGMQQSL